MLVSRLKVFSKFSKQPPDLQELSSARKCSSVQNIPQVLQYYRANKVRADWNLRLRVVFGQRASSNLILRFPRIIIFSLEITNFDFITVLPGSTS